MEVETFIESVKQNNFSSFKNKEVLAIIKGCHEKTRTTFFKDAGAVTGVDDQWKKIAIMLVAYTISQMGSNLYNDVGGIQGMVYCEAVGNLIKDNTVLWEDVFKKYLEQIQAVIDKDFMKKFITETTQVNFIEGIHTQQNYLDCITICFALVRIYDTEHFENYCRKWEEILETDIVKGYRVARTLSEYESYSVLRDGIRPYIENKVNEISNRKTWSQIEKRNRGIATATHDVFTIREQRNVVHDEYDQGPEVHGWLEDSEIRSFFPGMKSIPDCHIHNVSYGSWETASNTGGCVTGDTMIRLGNGREIPISKIHPGMKILSDKRRISVTSDEQIVNRHITRLYGINKIPPFMSWEHAVMTTDGWKSLDPETTNKINSFYQATLLREGDMVVTSDGIKKVDTITRKYADADKNEYFVGYDLHFREGYHSYFANGILVLLNYPEITLSRVKKVMKEMNADEQERLVNMVKQNYDIFCDIFGELTMKQFEEEIIR